MYGKVRGCKAELCLQGTSPADTAQITSSTDFSATVESYFAATGSDLVLLMPDDLLHSQASQCDCLSCVQTHGRHATRCPWPQDIWGWQQPQLAAAVASYMVQVDISTLKLLQLLLRCGRRCCQRPQPFRPRQCPQPFRPRQCPPQFQHSLKTCASCRQAFRSVLSLMCLGGAWREHTSSQRTDVNYDARLNLSSKRAAQSCMSVQMTKSYCAPQSSA